MSTCSIESKLSPLPLLAAAESYQGSMIDLEQGRIIRPDSFRRGWSALTVSLAQRGLVEGQRVVLAVSNGPSFIASLLAVIKCGGSPILAHAKSPPAELVRTARHFGAHHILSSEWKFKDFREAADGANRLDFAWSDLVWADVSDDLEHSGPPLVGVPLHPTSGTTGRSKIAVRPAEVALAEASHYIDAIGIDSQDVVLVATPQSHAYAYGMGVMVPLLSGASIVTMRMFNPLLVRRAFTDHQVTIFPAVPAMLDMLLLEPAAELGITARALFSAGAPLSQQTASEFQRRTGLTVRPLYGTTETGGISVGSEEHGRVAGCVGPAMAGVEVFVQPHDEDQVAGLGRLLVRSPSMMAGYLESGGVNTSSLVDGWFETGDLASLDPQAAICLSGRQTDLINVCGMKVVPSEVETVIAAIPEVAEVKVYGTDTVKAVIVPEGKIDQATVHRHCEQQLVYYKRPTQLTLMDGLPKTPSGKVIRDQLP